MPSENASPGFCTGMGALDTQANTNQSYKGVTWDDIVAMAAAPASVPKEQAQWIIPSYYRGPDARSHAVQRERGQFHALAFDIDRGNPSLEDIMAAVGKRLGGIRCLIYATRSAKPEARKWRGLLPLAQPLPGAWYGPVQDALFDALEAEGLHPDRSLARPGQLVYLPNKGEHYKSRLIEGPPLDIAAHPGLTSRAEAYAELQEAVSSGQAQAAKKEGPRSHLAAFRRKHSIAELLALYGYVQKGNSDHWRSPYQQSGSYATQDRGDHWISLSESDAEAKLGRATKNGLRYGDAFDLYVHFQHDGNYQMAEAYAKECLKEEDDARYGDATVEHGREVWEGLIWVGDKLGPAGHKPGTTALFQVQRVAGTEETVKMEYYAGLDPWLPKGTVVGVYGRGESGKSSWVSTMVAKASREVTTLWISSEEHPDHIAVRYTNSGGEYGAMFRLSGTPTVADSDKVVVFDVYKHLERTIQDHMMLARPDRPLGIVVLDAIGALVTWPKGDNANDDGSVKRLIAHLHSLSLRYGLTIIIIGHMNKNPKTEHIADAVTGSLSWTSSVRRAFLFYKDKASESDYAFFVRTAKANLGTHFAASYRTVPVHTIHQRADAPGEVLCKIEFTSPIVWGEKAISDLINDSPEEDPNYKAKVNRKSKEQARIDLIAEAIKAGHRTRQEIIAYAATVDVKLHGYHFTTQCDEALRARGIRIEAQAHNKLLYIA